MAHGARAYPPPHGRRRVLSRKALLLAPDLSGNSSLTPWEFSGALTLLGVNSRILGPASGPLWKPLEDELAGATRLPGAWAGGGVTLPTALREAARTADLVYAFKALPTSLLPALRVSRQSEVPLALHLDDWDGGFFSGRSRARRLWWALRRPHLPTNEAWLRFCELLIPRASALTVSSKALQRRFGGTVLRQGVDTGRLSPNRFPRGAARQRLGIPERRPMVLFLGTPRQHKGLSALLSLPELVSAIWLVGARRETLRELGLDETRLSQVEIRPPQSYLEAARYISACDVFVVPQEDTVFAAHQVPAKILMAMSLGVPIVTTGVGDAQEILGGHPPAGLVVPPGDPEALGRGVREVLSSPSLGAELGREARRRAEAELGWAAMARKLKSILPFPTDLDSG